MTARRNIPQKVTPLHFKTVTPLTFAALKEHFSGFSFSSIPKISLFF